MVGKSIDYDDFETIYRKYFKDVYKYLLTLCRNENVAEEIAQETFFKAMKAINLFEERCSIFVWLCQIAKNTYFNYCKKNQNYQYETEIQDDDIVIKLEDREEAKQIHVLLHKLQEPYKEVFMLRIFGELSFAQIAELFDKSESWARVTFYRAKAKLKEDLRC